MGFILVDRVLEIVPGERARGLKNITINEEILRDHFPGFPLFPGTMVLEALAQLGGFLAECSVNDISLDDSNERSGPEKERNNPPPDRSDIKRAMLVQVERSKFHRPVTPGDCLELDCVLLSELGGAVQIEGEARVNTERVTKVRFTFATRRVAIPEIHAQRRAIYKNWTGHLTLDFALP